MPVISRIWARSALISAGLQPQQKLEPGRLVSAIGLLIPQCRPGRTTKTPRLQGNLSRRSRSYGHSMGVNTPARKSALESPDERALWMKALLLYMSHLLPGMLSRDRDFQAYGPHPSEAAQLFHLFRTAYTTAEFCAEATARRSHGGDGAAGLISKAQAAVSRAGLFL